MNRAILVLASIVCGACSSSSSNGGAPPPPAGATTGVVAVALNACDADVYTASIQIGGRPFPLFLDTGSATLAVAGPGCTTCTQAGASTLYAPGDGAIDEHAAVDALYGNPLNATGFKGEIYEDAVGVGPGALANMARVKLVAMTEQSNFLLSKCGGVVPEGVIGFGPQSLANAGTNVFFDEVLAVSPGLSNVFATRLCPKDGTLWLGGWDSAALAADPVYTPMLGQAWYAVDLESVGVDGKSFAVPTGSFTEALIDTGSNISTFPKATFNPLTQAITENAAFAQIFGPAVQTFFLNPNGCVALSRTKAELDAALPPLTFTFGAQSPVTVRALATESYLLVRGGAYCPAIIADEPGPNYPNIASHLGAPFLASSVTIYDRQNQRIGFAPHAPCP